MQLLPLLVLEIPERGKRFKVVLPELVCGLLLAFNQGLVDGLAFLVLVLEAQSVLVHLVGLPLLVLQELVDVLQGIDGHIHFLSAVVTSAAGLCSCQLPASLDAVDDAEEF